MKFFHTNKFNILFYPYPTQFFYSSITIKIGSNDEKIGERGLAHFLEHMIFKGSKNVNDSIVLLESLGCYMNAYTFYDETKYFIYGNHIHYETILSVLIDYLLNPNFPKKTFEKEIQVVMEEIRLSDNDFEESLMSYQMKDLYQKYDKPFSQRIIGEIKDIKTFSKKKIMSFFKNYYEKSKYYLTIFGKFQEKKVKQYLEKIIGEPLIPYVPVFKKIEKSLKIPFFPTQDKPTIKFFKKKEVEQNLTNIVFRFTNIYNKNIETMFLLLNIIGDSQTSLLFLLLREKFGLTYNQGCDFSIFKNHGYVQIFFESDVKNTKKIIELIWKKISNYKIKEKELEIAKEIYKSEFLIKKENLLDWVEIVEENWIIEKKIPSLQNIEKIRLSDVQNLLENVFSKKNMYIYSIGNFKKIPTIHFD